MTGYKKWLKKNNKKSNWKLDTNKKNDQVQVNVGDQGHVSVDIGFGV